jgi:primosomal protein N' (replication factor Y)
VADSCPSCRGTRLQPRGIAVQKVAEKVRELFPTFPSLRLDTDSIRRKGELSDVLAQFSSGQYSILIGTQMVAKGFDFPKVTLVGVILADTGLYLPDFRAAERTFQILTQVAGRAGRRQERGEVIIQTYFPDDSGIRHSLSQDYAAFFQEEIAHRRALHYPPASRLAIIRLEGADEKKTAECARKTGEFLQTAVRKQPGPGLEIKGPVNAAIYRIKNQYRYFILIKADPGMHLHLFLTQVLAEGESLGVANTARGPRLYIEVDPQNVL